jgi:hypothetical protein
MANPTTNYGFVLPTSTDLVTDLPADFDVALQGVDTRLKALQPGTTLGDIAYSSATANTNTRLAIGSTGNVLTVAGGVPTWAAPAGGGPTGYTLLNSGGTSLSGAITTVSFSAQKKLWIYFINASDSATGAQISVRFNGDTGATNHIYLASAVLGNSSWAVTNVRNQNGSSGGTGADLLYLSSNADSTALGSITMDLADTTGWKTFDFFGAPTAGSGNGQWQLNGTGLYKASAAITSVSLYGNNFDAGTMFVYGAS